MRRWHANSKPVSTVLFKSWYQITYYLRSFSPLTALKNPSLLSSTSQYNPSHVLVSITATAGLSHYYHTKNTFLLCSFATFFYLLVGFFCCITFDLSGPPYRLPPTGWFGHLTWLSIARLPRSWWVLLYNFLVTSWLSQPLVVGCWMQKKFHVITRQPLFFPVLKSFPFSLQNLIFSNSVTNK